MAVRLIFAVMLLAAGTSIKASPSVTQDEGVLSNEALAKEERALGRLKRADKVKVRRALAFLKEAQNIASVSTDFEEIAGVSRRADSAVDAALIVIPDGALKGALTSCKKALGHSFILRLVHRGTLDPSDSQISEALEDIMLRYRLAVIPEYERPAKVLDYARAHLLIANSIAAKVGITTR